MPLHLSIQAFLVAARRKFPDHGVTLRTIETFATYYNRFVANLVMGLAKGQTAYIGDCPFCEKRNYFAVDPFSGEWDCPSCMQRGGLVEFINRSHPGYLSDAEALALAVEVLQPIFDVGVQ